MSLRPLIAIYGTTGVGKSKLAIELALALAERERGGGYRGARIINADAMQVYAGLDILTNKVPVEEQRGVEHLLMGFKRPSEQYVVGEWVKDAMRAVRSSCSEVQPGLMTRLADRRNSSAKTNTYCRRRDRILDTTPAVSGQVSDWRRARYTVWSRLCTITEAG